MLQSQDFETIDDVVLFCSPECLEQLQTKQLLGKIDERLIGIVVDESHCVVTALVSRI